MLRDELLVFAAADEDERVATATAKLEVAIYNTFHFVSWHARDLLTHRDAALDMFKHAEHEHLKAMTLERLVLDLLRGRDVAELEAELRTLGEQDSNGAQNPPQAEARSRGRLGGKRLKAFGSLRPLSIRS